MGLCAVLLFAGFFSLGVWQVHRRHWKLDLIARVTERVHAPAVDAPGPAQWPRVTPQADEYLHVRLRGTWLPDHNTLVRASTVLGPGYWVLTPLRRADGTLVLINRGFVAQDARGDATALTPPAGPVTVTGLLRMSEPRGTLLQHNDPGQGRWYSRDVAAIARAQGLHGVAPYFVDADAAPPAAAQPASAPVGGLTVISFHNSHLLYAIIWFSLSAMVAWGAWMVVRDEMNLRRS